MVSLLFYGSDKQMTPKRPVLNRRWFTPPALVLLGHALLAALIFWADAPVIQAGVAVVVVLFGSGFSLVAVLFPGTAEPDLVERLALAGGLSLAIGGMLGFALALSPWGLTLIPLLVVTALFNLACYAITVYQSRSMTDAPGDEELSGRFYLKHWLAGQSTGSIALTVALIAIIGLGAWTLKQTAVNANGDPPMTEFFLLGSSGLANAYPETVEPGEPVTVHYGIVNRHDRAGVYEIRATVADTVVARSAPMTLQPGETLETELRVEWPLEGPGTVPGLHKLDFVLYRGEQAHRSLHLWLEVMAGVSQVDMEAHSDDSGS